MDRIEIYIQYTALGIEALGVVALLIGAVIALARFVISIRNSTPHSYTMLRRELGKAILLGLEILVAGDIISTVVTKPTMDQVLALGVIVLIRTFLSFSIEVEIEGKFPWQNAKR
jgi:uncharacterized membrane protein